MMQPPIRIAVRVPDTTALPRWIGRLLSAIEETDGLYCCAVIPGPRAVTTSLPIVVRAWLKAEALLVARSTPVQRTVKVKGPECLWTCRSDVILDLTGLCGRDISPRLAGHGIWFVDCVSEEQGLAGLRSLLRRDAVNPLSLHRIGSDGEVRTIAAGAVNPKYLAARNELFLKEKSVALILRELRRLALTGSVAEEVDRPFAPFVAPSLREFAGYAARSLDESLRRVGEKLLARIGLRPGMFQINTVAGSFPDFDPARARPNAPAQNVYHADPFLWQRDGYDYCFFESYDYRTAKGHISVGRFVDGQLSDIRTAVQTDYHLSFPFVFEHGGELFMMPEACAKKRIELWRCTGFPDRWELHSTAMDGVTAADSSLAEIDGRWWLFTNISSDPFGDTNSELHLFQVDGPDLQTIIPHPLNPVQFDARYARNAGRVIRRGDALLRPAQENSHGTYGYGLNLMRIETLSMEAYRERLLRRIEPNFMPGLIGCHHLDVRGDLIVFDTRHRVGGKGWRPPRRSATA
jgi:hypothetical protein